jgi:serine/threonine protein kinase
MNEETLLVGTPNFIPPEIIEEQEVSEKVDAFAIGSLLYFL